MQTSTTLADPVDPPCIQRRCLLAASAASAASALAPLFVRHALAADQPRFGLGVASGQPQAEGLVLWTMLTGPDLPAQVAVDWELADSDRFSRVLARGTEQALQADNHSVHAEPSGLAPGRWYWYRFSALGQRSAPGRTRTAPAAGAAVARLDVAMASCQRFDVGHFAAWSHLAAEQLDLVLFLGDYIYEYASSHTALRPHAGGLVRTLADYRQRYAQYKSDPALQAAHAACPWLMVWDDHEVDNDYAGLHGQTLQPHFAAQRAAAYQAYWEHMPFSQAARPVDGAMRIVGRLDWGRLARLHLLDDRQYRSVQACPRSGRGGSNTVVLRNCPDLADPRRSLLGPEQERWLAQGWSLDRPWNLLAQQTLMARLAWSDPSAADGGTYWTDGWDGYAASRQRLLATVAERAVPGVVVLGGDVHANCVADLRLDFSRPESAVLATEFCGTSISSLGLAQSRLDAAVPFNPHLKYARSDQRGYARLAFTAEQLTTHLMVLSDARDIHSRISSAARFVVAADQPGALPA